MRLMKGACNSRSEAGYGADGRGIRGARVGEWQHAPIAVLVQPPGTDARMGDSLTFPCLSPLPTGSRDTVHP